MHVVPASTPIKRRSTPNVESTRLIRRLEWLRAKLKDSRWAEQKAPWKARVIEAIHVEDELRRRGLRFHPVTRR